MNEATKLEITGMTCTHCRKAVEDALATVPGVNGVQVDLDRGVALVGGAPDPDALVAAVEDEGYGASVAR